MNASVFRVAGAIIWTVENVDKTVDALSVSVKARVFGPGSAVKLIAQLPVLQVAGPYVEPVPPIGVTVMVISVFELEIYWRLRPGTVCAESPEAGTAAVLGVCEAAFAVAGNVYVSSTGTGAAATAGAGVFAAAGPDGSNAASACEPEPGDEGPPPLVQPASAMPTAKNAPDMIRRPAEFGPCSGARCFMLHARHGAAGTST